MAAESAAILCYHLLSTRPTPMNGTTFHNLGKENLNSDAHTARQRALERMFVAFGNVGMRGGMRIIIH
jgi:hypothetical protein